MPDLIKCITQTKVPSRKISIFSFPEQSANSRLVLSIRRDISLKSANLRNEVKKEQQQQAKKKNKGGESRCMDVGEAF